MTKTLMQAMILSERYKQEPETVSRARLAEMLEKVIALKGGKIKFRCINYGCKQNCLNVFHNGVVKSTQCLRYAQQQTLLKCIDKTLEEVKV